MVEFGEFLFLLGSNFLLLYCLVLLFQIDLAFVNFLLLFSSDVLVLHVKRDWVRRWGLVVFVTVNVVILSVRL